MEIGALLLTAGAAHLLVLTLGHHGHGPPLLVTAGAGFILVGFLHRWRTHRRALTPRPAAPAPLPWPRDPMAEEGAETLWRIRVGVADVPGGLATLTTQLARLGVNIRLMQVLPGYVDAVDEFLASVPRHVARERLADAVVRAGGRDPVIEPADAHELIDTTSRTLALVAELVTEPGTLSAALLSLTGADTVARLSRPPEGLAADEVSGPVMCLAAPGGGVLVLRRAGVPFGPVEFARCRALVDVAALLRRTGASREAGSEIREP
ncbi:amino acid-binding protein [Marinitenerispora sediminis]|uniref:Amino acid-binding protein n=1 Tax=Marinitenerispora sediminis TaxID=1931232 RepID=A0A368SY90_9ACTN|nr:amino acid-binding protein [Marinitenerispora sediminis]RCV57812.1 amino acid-binding protein [Marinitenerispora sediminis]RCV59553.1 amino acid-binding protein [Marinitenerispora sediminis]